MLKAYDILTRAFRVAGAICVIAMLVILLASIVLRELFALPLVWANEVSIALFVWTVFLGAGVATAENAHIRFDIVASRLPLAGRRTLGLLVTYGGLVLLVGFWLTSIYVTYVYRDQRFTTIVASAAWQWAAVPAGTLLAIVGWLRHGKWRWREGELTEKPASEIPGI
ncbi:MAG TPA: TRAP transporter small permease subunit [Casimicrobiaceae bacterium]|nr:TRAP transporter small permease subunit [Casimicrobiaceae bacterium]